jgi:hypothetical protein
LIALGGAPTPASADEGLTAIAQVSLPYNLNSFDIAFVDPAINLFALADRGPAGSTNGCVDMIDTVAFTLSQFCGMQGQTGNKGPNGLAIILHHYIVVGDGDGTMKTFTVGGTLVSSVRLINPQSGMPTTGRADELCFDPVHGKMMITSDQETPFPISTAVSLRGGAQQTIVWNVANLAAEKLWTGPGTFVGPVPSGGATAGAEQCQFDPATNTFWMNIPECGGSKSNIGCVVEVDPVAFVPLHVFQYAPNTACGLSTPAAFAIPTLPLPTVVPVPATAGGGPTGMAIGPSGSGEIAIGCAFSFGNNANSMIINDGTTGAKGNPDRVFTATSDEVWFNASANGGNHYYLAGSNFNNNPSTTAACNLATGGGAGPGFTFMIDAAGTGKGTADGALETNLANCAAGTAIGPHGGAHTLAGDPAHNLVFIPIRDTSGVNLCSSQGGSDTAGCIMIFREGSPDADD